MQLFLRDSDINVFGLLFGTNRRNQRTICLYSVHYHHLELGVKEAAATIRGSRGSRIVCRDDQMTGTVVEKRQAFA